MRFSWLTLSFVISFACVAGAQEATKTAKPTALQRMMAPKDSTPLVGAKDNQINNVIPFDQYDSVTGRLRIIIVAQRDLMKKVDAEQVVASITAEQAQKNYLEKLKYLRGMKEQLENAYRSINPKLTTEIAATKVEVDDYLGYLAPLFSAAESSQPNFINDCGELQKIGMTQHFNLNGKEAVVVFRGDRVFNTLVAILCPKYSN